MWRKSKALLGCIASLLCMLVSWAATEVSAAEPPFIEPNANWLTTVNYFRAMAGLGPVVEDPSMSAGSYNHSCYMLLNGISHDEIPGNPGYTPEGDNAGNHGNVAVSSVFDATARSHIELWMTGPYHAIGVLRPNLQSVGFGKCDNTSTSPWRSGATLDVLDGLGAPVAQSAPILFPGNGTTTSLNRFVTESPNPLDSCGWSGSAGLPVLALMPEGFAAPPSGTFSGSTGPLEVCVLSAKNTSGVAQQILNGNNAVVLIPRNPLTPDTYTATVSTSARTVTWSFTVDPDAATGIQPPQTTAPIGTSTAMQPLPPARIVDTRINLGASRLVGAIGKRIQVTGQGGVPVGAQAVSANFTITNAAAPGYLTVWNCGGDRPVVSTLNYNTADTVPNGASVPLDATGGLCVYSLADADLIIDVNGYYSAGGDGHFAPVAPTRLMDSRIGLGAAGRLGAGTVQPLQVAGVAGVPGSARLVMLNVTSVLPDLAGFVTVYPCDQPRPMASSLNPVPGKVKPNLVISPVAADGTVCLYTLTDVDLVVDITGYVSAEATMNFTPTSPFRLTDTRDRNRPELQAGTNGQPAVQGQTLVIQVAGNRGIAANAKAISANVTVTGAIGPGYATAWPCGEPPSTSTVNYEAGAAVANGSQIPLSATGQLCVFVSNDVHVIVDVNGWWS
jgi:Cysteine-rich secretory protein family